MGKTWRIIAMCLLSLLAVANAFAQTKVLNGTVLDGTTNEPLIGVSVVVKGTTTGTATDANGQFSINVPSDAILSVSYVGYLKKEIPVGNQSQLTITLSEDSNLLDEVVVVGYGTMRKKDLTGSVVQIRPDALSAENPKTVQDILRGTAGMAISYDTSAKGGGWFEIRGQRSVYGPDSNNRDRAYNPLIVLDGMIFNGELSEINPEDIGQIDILKDASAAAIYGTQAANGVIIITTKKGKVGRPVVNVSSNIGFVSRSAYREVYSPEGYMQLREDYWKISTYGVNPTTGKYEPYQKSNNNLGYFDHPNKLAQYGVSLDQWRGYTVNAAGESDASIWARRIGLGGEGTQLLLDNYLAGKTFDWWGHTFQTGINHDHTASVSGASDRINYYMSFGYLNSHGAIINDDYTAVRSNLKVEGKVTNWLEVGANVNFQNRTDGPIQPNLSTAPGDNNQNQIRNSPYGVYRDEDGNLAQFPHGGTAIGKGKNFDFDRQYQELDKGYIVLNSIFNVKVKLPFEITYSFNASPRYQWFHDHYWESSAHPSWKASNNGLVNRENNWRFDWGINNQINWEKAFAKVHRVNLTLVQEAERRQSWLDRIEARNFEPSDALGFHNTANATTVNVRTEDTQQSADALLGRLFYSYDDRYMLTTSLRRDGYSAFGTNNPYAVFPSLGLAWTFTNEKFINWKPLDYGKLRISWGKNGNRGLRDPYVALADLTTGGSNRYGYLTSSGQLIDFHYLRINRMENPNLQWEKSKAWNIGLDFSLLKNRISGAIECYSISTNNMIMEQTLPQFSGFASIYTNLGEVSNKGIEVSITSNNIKTDVFEWSTTLNFAYNQNRIVHLYYENENVLDASGNVIGSKEKDDKTNGWFIGHPISAVWDYRVIGIWQVDEVDEAKKYGQVPGDPKVKNNPDNDTQKADGSTQIVYNDEDREFLGQRAAPINWSMRNDFTLFKNWTFSFNMYSKMGFMSRPDQNWYLNQINGSNQLRQGSNIFVTEYWTPENPSNKYGRIDAQGPPNGGASSAWKYYDRSFIRLENVSIGYSIPKKWILKYNIERVKIFGSIRNAMVWQKEWPFGDPETSNLATRTFSLGLNLTF